MNVASAIIKSRKKLGWSQEELANCLDVSRQSVSKWESGQSIPDLDKIARLADVFGVSTDYLIRGAEAQNPSTANPTPKAMVGLDEANRYIEAKYLASKSVIKGVALCVCSPMPLILLLAAVRGELIDITQTTAAAIGIVSILLLVAMAIGSFVKSNEQETHVRELSAVDFTVSTVTKATLAKQKQEFSSVYTKWTTIGVMLFILAAAPFLSVAILLKTTSLTLFALASIFPIIALGIALVAPVSAKRDAIDLLLKEGDLDKGKSEHVKNCEKIGAFYFPLLTAIFLGWSFWTMRWDITWIIWPVGSVAFPALVALVGLFKKDKTA